MPKVERRKAQIVVVDRENLAERIDNLANARGLPVQVAPFASVLEVVGEKGPAGAAGLVLSVKAAGPFLHDLLRWTDRDEDLRIPTAVIGRDSDESAISAVLGRDHVKWIDAENPDEALEKWLLLAIEVQDLRAFRAQHDAIAAQLREARTRLFLGELDDYTPPEGPPCGPPLPTTIEEIQSLREAKAQFERGLIRAAVRESGSLKDASAALGISYTSLWRRMR